MEAGLAEVPCIELDVSESEVLEIALIENLHRKDLHPFEEAEGYSGLAQRHGYTQQQVADAIGKSRVSVTEAMSLLDIPEELRDECRRADISKSTLLEVARLKDPEKMREAIARAASGSTRDDLRAQKKEEDPESRRPRRFEFVYKPKGGPFKLALSFAKSRVDKSELVQVLKDVVKQLESGEIKLPKR
jgi:ParB family chromosome partitioning protein